MSAVLAIQPAIPLAGVDLGSFAMPDLTRAPSHRRADEIQFFVVFGLTLPVFLVVSLVGRLFPVRSGRARETLSVIQEAKASAQTCGSLSLMG